MIQFNFNEIIEVEDHQAGEALEEVEEEVHLEEVEEEDVDVEDFKYSNARKPQSNLLKKSVIFCEKMKYIYINLG